MLSNCCKNCGTRGIPLSGEYESMYLDAKTQKRIVVPNIITYDCPNCDHKWIPEADEHKIDMEIIARRGRD